MRISAHTHLHASTTSVTNLILAAMAAGLKTVILLSFVLAVGFLMIILSCALWHNWLPLLVALIFVLAPLPNALFSHCGADDFSGHYDSAGPVDLGRFITSMIVVTGFALPIVLAHSEVIRPAACAMSILGGGLVYGTILAYSAAFKQEESDYD
ncbi:Vacuolar protein sorting-associated protein 55 [Pleurotus ostreatus]|nr:Vacuolar protein sorting-associated protein 55 [Pleurotus ostreatus]